MTEKFLHFHSLRYQVLLSLSRTSGTLAVINGFLQLPPLVLILKSEKRDEGCIRVAQTHSVHKGQFSSRRIDLEVTCGFHFLV